MTQLSTPNDFTASPASSSQNNLTWTDVANETNYIIYWNTVSDFGTASVLASPAANSTSYNHTGLTASTTYYYWLIAVGDGVIYSNSNSTLDDATTDISYDSDALAYINAVESAGRTLTSTEKGHINTLISGWKSDGVFSLIVDGIIPIWGTSSPSVVAVKQTHTFAAVASPTFSSSGVDFNGSSQYITTTIVPGTHLNANDAAMFYYSQENVNETTVDMGSVTTSNRFELHSRSGGNLIGRVWNSANGQTSQANSSSQGLLGVVRASTSDLRVFRNGTQVGSTVTTSTTLGSRPTHAIYIGARNTDGTASLFSTKKCSAAFVLNGMTTTQVSDFTTRLETFMDAMGIGIIP